MSKATKFLWAILSAACLMQSANIDAKGGGGTTTPVDTLPINLQAEIALSEDILGSLSLSGNTIAANCRYTSATGVLMNAMCMLQKTATGWVLQGKVSPLPAASKLVREPVLNGNTLLIPVYDPITTNYEYYVFVRNTTGLWVQQTKIVPTAGEVFGSWAGLSGDTLAIAASSPTGLPNGGAAVFQRTTTTTGVAWTRQASLKLPVGNLYAPSVALSGDTAVVTGSNNGIDGAAYVYKRTGTLWVQQAKLVSNDTTPFSDGFGYSSAISGDNIIIGAPYAAGKNPKYSAWGTDGRYWPGYASVAGAAYTYHRTNGIWKQEAKLERSLTAANPMDYFGNDVVANGDAVMVRAAGSNDRAASVYVYQRSLTGTWPLVSKVDPEGTYISLTLPGFDRSIGLEGNTYVSAGRHNLLGQPLKRRIFVFNK